jgi:ABC-type transport system involved in multi-copper enzyme maturation permease subunit
MRGTIGNLIRNEWWVNRRNFLIALVVIPGFQILFSGVANIFLQNTDMVKMVEMIPSAMMEAFGFYPELMTTFEGWMSSEPLTFYLMLFGGFAAVWGSLTVARERSSKTQDFLFSLPYTRLQIFMSRVLAQLVQMLVVFLVTLGSVYLFGSLFSSIAKPEVILIMMLSGLLIAMAFAGIGYIFTVLVRTERGAMSVSIGIVMISFLLKMLSGLDSSISWLSKLSIFNIFDSLRMATESYLSWTGIAICLLVYFLGIALGAIMLRQQDI